MKRQLSNAGLPPTLYKYRDWTKEKEKLTILNREVYLTAPSSFEDKKDCKIPIRYDLLRNRHIWRRYNFDVKIKYPELSWSEQCKIVEEWYQASPLHNMKGIMEEQEKDFKKFDMSFGVFCSTPNNNNYNMWIKYSKNHSGFCVGFNPEIFCTFFGGGGYVIYCPSLPIIKPWPYHSYDDQIV
jgi:hypothetical protein